MPMYTVSQGDCLSSIAKAHGLADWRVIYHHAQNAKFRALRPDPNVIYPGDQVFVPELEEGIEGAVTDKLNPFKLKASPVKLRIVLLNEDHHPMPNTPYTLRIADIDIAGQSDADGLLEHTIPANAAKASLTIRFIREGEQTGYTWDLLPGSLDPETVMTGVQSRLNNLGFNTGPVDGIQGSRTTEAIRKFQEMHGLVADGICGPMTRSKLVEVHGC